MKEKPNHKVITSLMLRTFSSADEIFLIMKSLFVRFLKCSLPLKDGPGFSNVCIYVVFWLLKINLEMERISGQKSQEAIEKWTELILKLAAEENNYKSYNFSKVTIYYLVSNSNNTSCC